MLYSIIVCSQEEVKDLSDKRFSEILGSVFDELFFIYAGSYFPILYQACLRITFNAISLNFAIHKLGFVCSIPHTWTVQFSILILRFYLSQSDFFPLFSQVSVFKNTNLIAVFFVIPVPIQSYLASFVKHYSAAIFLSL